MINYKEGFRLFSNDFLNRLSEEKDDGRFFEPGGMTTSCVMIILDIVGFDSIANNYSAEQLVEFIQKYYELVFSDVYQKNGFVYNATGVQIEIILYNKDNNCLQNAIELLFIVKKNVEKYLKERTGDICRFISSISSGDILFINLGTKKRMISSIMGRDYSIAMQLKELNRSYLTSVIISKNISALLHGFIIRDLDTVKFEHDKELYTIEEPIIDDGLERTRNAIIRFNLGISYMKKKNWEKSIDEFSAVLSIKENDLPSKVMINRCMSFIKQKPADAWDGVYQIRQRD